MVSGKAVVLCVWCCHMIRFSCTVHVVSKVIACQSLSNESILLNDAVFAVCVVCVVSVVSLRWRDLLVALVAGDAAFMNARSALVVHR